MLLSGWLTLTCALLVSASSTAREPLRRIHVAKNPSILTQTHRVTALSTFDLALDISGTRFRLSLEPNHDIFVQGATVQYLGADGNIAREEPIDRLQHKIFKGLAWVKRGNRWDQVGWARIEVQRDGVQPLFEGTFTVNHDHHHVQLARTFQQTRMAEDPEIQDIKDGDDYMVVFRNSDIGWPQDHQELRKRGADSLCGSDDLGFNNQEDHPVYAELRSRNADNLFSVPYSDLLGKRQDTPGGTGNSAGGNLVASIGSTAGCPTTRKVALVGVAADCTYTQSFSSSTNQTRDNIIKQMNSASELFESTFNISLGLANVLVTEPGCPTSAQAATPWNQACSVPNLDIQARLNLFSAWRGKQNDQYSHWTLLSTCNSGSAVGLAWLGQACVTGAQNTNSSSGGSDSVSGANVVVRTSTEWQVIAHETGHTFGAVHDCSSSTCSNTNTVSAQQCCPLSSSSCDARAQFIMNPSTAEGITRFSPCSIGNICSALGRNSVKSTCFSNNRGVTTITGQTCGNGIVEGDEQCDCGGTTGCGSNSCCDAKTCKFKNNAVCDDSNEDCCRNCQFASANTTCRPSTSSCDPAETCTGNSPYCPEDKSQPDGTNCGDGLKCASGQCTSRNQQCKTVMGSYTQGNDTYACDNSNCMLSCASPEFGRGVCYGLQQNFLDGTPCVGGGQCRNGICSGASVGKEFKNWIDEHKTLFIGLVAGVGSLLVLAILTCCWRSYKRRKTRKIYANNVPTARAHMPPGGLGYAQQHPSRRTNGSRSRSRGQSRGLQGPEQTYPPPPEMNHSAQSPAQGGYGSPWNPHPPPPPAAAVSQPRRSSVRYA